MTRDVMTPNPIATIARRNVSQLLARWWAAVGLCFMMLLSGFFVFNQRLSGPNAIQWIFQSFIVMIYVLGLLRYGLRWNYHPAQKILRATLGYGTWLTILRGGLLAVLAGCLFQPWPESKFFPDRLSWAPGLVYITASILDYSDGLVARACRHETRLGAFLDIHLDALGLLVAPLLAVWYGQLPIAYLSVGFAYYLFRGAIRLRKKYSKPTLEPKPWRGARVIAGLQMGFVGITLLPVAAPPVTTVTAYLLMIPLWAGFFRDWLFVCGYLTSGSFFETIQQRGIKSFFINEI